MKSRTGYRIVLALALAFSQSCSRESSKEVHADGIQIKSPIRGDGGTYFYIKSDNAEYDCINLNGINGEGEDLKGDDQEHLSLSDSEYGKSDIIYYDNKPNENLLNITGSFKKIDLSENYKFAMFVIFNCKKFQENKQQRVYIYVSKRL